MTPEAFARSYAQIQLEAGSPPGPEVEVWVLLANGDEHHGMVAWLDVEDPAPPPETGVDVFAHHAFVMTEGSVESFIDVGAVVVMEKWEEPTPILTGNTALNVTAAAVISASPTTLRKLIVSAPGTVGNLVLNDTDDLGSVAAANQIVSIPFGSLVAGQIINLDWPCYTGLVVSAMTTGGVVSIQIA